MSLRFLRACVLAGTVGCTSADFASSEPGSDDSSVGDATGDDTVRPGDDSAVPDGSVPDGGVPDGDSGPPPVASCVGKPDGTPCDSSDGKRRICVAEGCTLSRCGDRIIDLAAGEECDDANTVPNDGCEPLTCKFSCRSAGDCPSTTCLTGRTCNAAHRCTEGTVQPKSTPCTLPGGGSGACNGGVCASASCGNGSPEAGEECDDGDTDPTNGCKNDCTFTCKVASDCDDHNACNGVESCNTGPHKCVLGTALTCEDSNPCTANTCASATGCSNPFIDGDGDGYAPVAAGTCGGTFAGKDGDCNDGSVSVHPGAPELCNGIDDNCNSTPDEGIPVSSCGVGECKRAGSSCLVSSCTAGPGTPEICDNKDNDCDGIVDDGVTRSCYTGPASTEGIGICHAGKQTCAAGVFGSTCTGQQTPITAFSTVKDSASGSFDYNCDGVAEQKYPGYGTCSTSTPCSVKTLGWYDDGSGTIPPCGATGSTVGACVYDDPFCSPDPSVMGVLTQSCR